MTRYSHKQPIHIDRCVISSPFGSLRISTELVDGSLMISEYALVLSVKGMVWCAKGKDIGVIGTLAP
jgi:hypothetical protein